MRHQAFVGTVVVVCALTFAGCGKTGMPSNSAAPPPGNNAAAIDSSSAGNASEPAASANNSSANTAADAPNAAAASAPVAPAKPIVVKPGTEIVVVADQSVSSKTSNSGDHFDASIAEPVVVGDHVIIPKGARATGTVLDAKSAGRFKGNAELTVALSSVTVKGKQYRVKTTEVTQSGKGRGKRTAVGAGGGAVVGGLIGALAGHGKGAAIGAAAGAGAGTAGTAMTGERDITINSESKLSFKLENALEIERK
jgi:outer membrane lipoprotein SlyB